MLGTRGYWAPEMLRRDIGGKRERYTVTVDWFSFGCVVYEFLYGISPFRTERARKWGNFPKLEKADRDRAIDISIQVSMCGRRCRSNINTRRTIHLMFKFFHEPSHPY